MSALVDDIAACAAFLFAAALGIAALAWAIATTRHPATPNARHAASIQPMPPAKPNMNASIRMTSR
jgi:multidrug resistance efflux pump